MKAALLLAACATLAATAATESTTSFAATENLSFPQDVIISSCRCSSIITAVLSVY